MGKQEERRDGQLLAAWLGGEEVAFGELVGRHGQMVLGACRRVLGSGPGAEDAAQAAFVALARKARSLVAASDVGAWLHRAAWFAASRELRAVRRREAHERDAALLRSDVSEPSSEPGDWGAIGPNLDGALEELPEKYRRVLTACYLQGRSQSEVARQLGLPQGTVASQCKRGLERLRRRLDARGLSPGAVELGTLLLSGCVLHEALPAGFAKGALLAFQGAAAGARAAGIAEVVMKTLFWIKAKKIAAVCAGALIVGLSAPSAVIAVRSARAGTPAKADPRVSRLEREVADLKKKVGDLEQQIRTLRLLVNRLPSGGGPAEIREEQRKAGAAIDALCSKLRTMGVKAGESEEFRKLVAFGAHRNRGVRAYQVAALAKLPIALSGPELERLVSGGPFDAARGAMEVLARFPKHDARKVVAARASATGMSYLAPDHGDRQLFVSAACDYLLARKDPRAVRIYMAKLAEQNSDLAAMRRRRAYGSLMLMSARTVNRYSRLTGYGRQFKSSRKTWASISDPRLQKFIADFLAWWEKNKADFTKIRAGQAAVGDEARHPEKF